MPPKDSAALMKKLEAVGADPFGARPWAKRLTGTAAFRARQGDWRAVYRIDRETRQVVVDHIDHRREVYR
jgi:mRNA-degrading endonuclease RelE of RelBE toxin-antitoxin system